MLLPAFFFTESDCVRQLCIGVCERFLGTHIGLNSIHVGNPSPNLPL